MNESRTAPAANAGESFLSLSPARQQRFDEVLSRMAQKLAEDEITFGVEFPYVTRPDGRWALMPASVSAGYSGENWSHGNWFCGFWVGLLLAAHLHTDEARFQTWAAERMRLVAQRADDGNTHDIGFIFESSAIPAFHMTGESWYAQLALRAADRLRARLVTTPAGAYLASWGPMDDPRGRRSSAIDTMANLPLLYWAANHSGDGSYRLAADAHAAMTARAFIRADGSTYHAVEYDEASGARTRGFTFQGVGDESDWSRGQAWAIYGYVISLRETHKRVYLDLVKTTTDHYFERLGDRLVPPWDFDATGADAAIKDTSTTAIVASALLELGNIHPDVAQATVWRERGLQMLDGLCQEEFASEAAHRGLLRNSCYSRPHRIGVASATMFGDYFFVEALCRAALPGRFLPVPPRLAMLHP